MDSKKLQNSHKNRFLKLSLNKNRQKAVEETKKLNRSSDVIILDDSFEELCTIFPKKVHSSPKIYSPIVLHDSDESLEDLPKAFPEKEPSRNGNISFNCSKEDTSFTNNKQSRPSIGGWSPAQTILCATPRHMTVPSTPKDVANESLEQCSIKKIQQSQKKLLDDLYGEVWKSIPTLFKTISHNHHNFDGVSKKLQFEDNDESDKENIKYDLETNKRLYLTGSDAKHKSQNHNDFNCTEKKSKKKLYTDVTGSDSKHKSQNHNDFDCAEKKSKKKLYTEKIPSTPDVPKQKPVRNTRNVQTTTKKKKAMSVTELVELRNDVEVLTKKVENFKVATTVDSGVKRLSFVGSLTDNTPSWRCHPEALQYHDNYKTLKEQLSRRLYVEFNKQVFGDSLDADMIIVWDTKLRSTAGTTTNRLIKNSKGDRIRTSSIKLSTKVVDGPQRLRDTLIHELCHAATWLIDGELRAGHGPLWKKWATRALRVFPELGDISRCHDLEIHFKYSYKCTKCGYSIKRHSKSIDITKKCCGYCRGTFEIIVNKKNKDGVVVSTPARKGGPNDFALYVKENYATMKNGTKSHAQVMKILGEQFSAKKKMATDVILD